MLPSLPPRPSICDSSQVSFGRPTQTVILISGTSHPIPAHLVLMRSRQPPALSAIITLSFSSLLLSPLSFSMWEGVRFGIASLSALLWAQAVMMSAVSFFRTNICIFSLALWSARRGKIQAQSLSMFQISNLLLSLLLCWNIFGLSQLLDSTNTSSLSMPRLILILSRLVVLKVAELSINGTPW